MNALQFSLLVVSLPSWPGVITLSAASLIILLTIVSTIFLIIYKPLKRTLWRKPIGRTDQEKIGHNLRGATFLSISLLLTILLNPGPEDTILKIEHLFLLGGVAVFVYYAFLGPSSIARSAAAGQGVGGALTWIVAGIALAAIAFIARDLIVEENSQLIPKIGEWLLSLL